MIFTGKWEIFFGKDQVLSRVESKTIGYRVSNSNPDIDHTNEPKFYRIEMQSMTRQSVTGPDKKNYLLEKERSES